MILFSGSVTTQVIGADGWFVRCFGEDRPLQNPVMAMDGSGKLHVAVGDTIAWGSGRDWTTTDIPIDMTHLSTMYFDSAGDRHLSASTPVDSESWYLHCAWEESGEWTSSSHLFEGTMQSYTLAPDKFGNPRALAVTQQTDDATGDHVTKVIGSNPVVFSWLEYEICTLEEGWRFCGLSSFIQDSDGWLHAFLVRMNPETQETATDHVVFNGIWDIDDELGFPSRAFEFSPRSGVMDDEGHFHLACTDSSEGGLYYITNRTGEWAEDEVTDPYDNFGLASIDVDSDGDPHIAYTTEGEEKLVVLTERHDAEWSSRVVDDRASYVNEPCSVAVDEDGGVHLCFEVKDDGYRVMYATDSAPDLVLTDAIVDSAVLTSAAAAVACSALVIAWYVTTSEKKMRDDEEVAGMLSTVEEKKGRDR